MRDFYDVRGRPAIAQVERGSAVDDALVAAGWSPAPDGDAHFLVGSLARALRAARGSGAGDADVVEDDDGLLVEATPGPGPGP